jgi:hypothetical protein
MNRRRTMIQGAEDDAMVGVENLDHRLMEILGTKPEFVPQVNHAHLAIAKDAVRDKELPPLRLAVHAAEEELSRHRPPSILFALLLVTR